jgi:imidazoleglycerol-phosphate dehydratase
MARTAEVNRKTKETDIHLVIDLDGRGSTGISTGIPFMDHMFTLFALHGFVDLELSAKGDTEVDDHHTVEDIGICLGKAVSEALGEKKGLRRYGEATIPMDEVLVRVVIDLSNRPFLSYRVPAQKHPGGTFDINLLKEFFRAFVSHVGMTMHIDLLAGEEDAHHIAEAIFKAFGRALDQATAYDDRLEGNVPSTKGLL